MATIKENRKETRKGLDKATRLLIRSFPGAIYLHDVVNDRNLYSSDKVALYIGYGPEEILQLAGGVRARIHPDDLPLVEQMNARIPDLKEDDTVEATYRFRHKKGHWVWIKSEEYVYQRNAEGAPLTVVGVAYDVTRIKESESQMERLADYNAFLVETSRLITEGTGDIHRTLQTLARSLAEQFKVVCNIFFLDPDGMTIRPGAVYYHDPEVVSILNDLFARYTVTLGEGMVGRTIQDGTEFVLHEVDEDTRTRTIAIDPRLEPTGLAYLPVKGYSQTIGVISLTRLVELRPLSEKDWENIAQVVRNVSLFVEHSLLTNERRLELEKLEKAEGHLKELNRFNSFQLEVSHLLSNVSSEMTAVLQQLAENITTHFEIACNIHLIDPATGIFNPLAVSHPNKRIGKKIFRFFKEKQFSSSVGMIGKVVRTGKEFLLQEVGSKDMKWFDTDDPDLIPGSLLFLPIKGRSGVLGVLDVTRTAPDMLIQKREALQLHEIAKSISLFIDNHITFEQKQDELAKRQAVEEKLEDQKRWVEFKLEISALLANVELGLKRTLQELVSRVAGHFNVVCDIQIVDSDKGYVELIAFHHHDPKVRKALEKRIRKMRTKIGEGMVGKVVSTGKELYMKKLPDDLCKKSERSNVDPLIIPSSLAYIPLKSRNNVIGTLNVSRLSHTPPLRKLEMEQIRDLANHVSLFVEHALLRDSQRREVEDRRRAESKLERLATILKKSEQDTLNVLNAIPVYIARLSKDLRFTFVNDAFLKAGIPPRSIEGKLLSEFMGETHMKNLDPYFSRTLSGETVTYDYDGTMPDDIHRYFNVAMEPDFSQDGTVIGFYVSASDISAERSRERGVMSAILKGQEQERKRLGAELHDGIGQVLSSIFLDVSRIQDETNVKKATETSDELKKLGTKVQTAIREVRNISHDLMPDVLESFGLKQAIRQVCSDLHEKTDIDVSFVHVDVEERYGPTLEVNLYRMIQEFLNNIQKHATSAKVFVNLMDHGETISLTVEDEGVGFDPQADHHGIGLKNVRTRVRSLGGEMDVSSAADNGTLINIEVPKKQV